MYGLSTGDTIDVDFFTDEQVEDPSLDPATADSAVHADARITGIGLFPDEVAQDQSDEIPRLVFTPALTRPHLDVASYEWQGLRPRPRPGGHCRRPCRLGAGSSWTMPSAPARTSPRGSPATSRRRGT